MECIRLENVTMDQPKMQAILRRARKGIVCLQETRWTASTATNFLQTYPGFNIAHTPSVVTENRGLSGGSYPSFMRL